MEYGKLEKLFCLEKQNHNVKKDKNKLELLIDIFNVNVLKSSRELINTTQW